MRLLCNMRFTLDGITIHEVGEVIERDYEEVKQAIRDRALIPLPDLPKETEQVIESVVNSSNVAKNAFNDAVNHLNEVANDSKPSVVSSDTSEVKEG